MSGHKYDGFIEKYDLFFSEALIPIGVFGTGLALYAALKISWIYSPLVLITATFFGISCMGLKRIKTFITKKDE